jgi:hypothetical protein
MGGFAAMVINVLTLSRLALALLLVVTLTCLSGQAQESRLRVISQAPVEASRQSPIQIVSVKFKGEAIEPGRRFLADDDWLTGLTFKVKNVSDRPISYVAISLRVPTAAGRENKFSEFVGPYRYGCPPGFSCLPEATRFQKEIMPGETQDVVVAERTYKNLTAALAQSGASIPIVAAEYDIDSVVFDADTRWSRGFLFRRDPSEPNTYRMVDKYELPKWP